MRKLAALAVFAVLLFLGRRRRPAGQPAGAGANVTEGRPEQIVAPAEPRRRAETVVLGTLAGATLCAAAFVAIYALDRLSHQTQLLGLALGLAFALLAVAAIVTAKAIVPDEEVEEHYAPPHEREQEETVQILEEAKSAFTRRRLLGLAAGGSAAALGVALLAPAASLGPVLDPDVLKRTPWHRGRRLVGEDGRPLSARDVERDTFYTAYPEGAPREDFAAPLVVVRLDPADLRLPARRSGWAPGGILAFSKICTHAGCAIALYRTPLFEPTSARPALVCPCHYSTFDPAKGGVVLFGPAGRPLPQLPLLVDGAGHLRAAGGFSGPPGPSWWGVRQR